ncbi:MAG TPA: GerMN domain-containing protein [Vicinamibacterales bacterium]|nr:GerMN domain-containing protein [Vicinamibacterales bacterium]
MNAPRAFGWYVALAALLVTGLITLLVLGPRWLTTPPDDAAAPAATAAADARKIRARLFYVDELGTGLQGVEQEVLYGATTAEQARRIIEAQIGPAPAPHVSAIPAGTKLRTVFFTKSGEVYVDLSADLQTNHPGGTTNETLTVYALVSALTANLPAVTGVQILVEGKEVETLAGHLDLRRPIEQDLKWVTN